MIKKVKLEDLFTIEYEETDPEWFRVKVNPKNSRRIIIDFTHLQIDIRESKTLSMLSVTPTQVDNPEKEFTSLILTGYSKDHEQGYYGRAEVNIEGYVVKAKKP